MLRNTVLRQLHRMYTYRYRVLDVTSQRASDQLALARNVLE
jgi:hypothetical protein